MKRLTVRLPEALDRRFRQEAALRGRTLSAAAREAVEEYLVARTARS
jgi:predicted transcriptional regulator